MNDTDDLRTADPKRITALLTQAVAQLDSDTVAALRKARSGALARQAHHPVFALSTGHGTHWLVPHSGRQWAATAFLLALLLAGGGSYWHHANELELALTDIAILTDELPMEIFVD